MNILKKAIAVVLFGNVVLSLSGVSSFAAENTGEGSSGACAAVSSSSAAPARPAATGGPSTGTAASSSGPAMTPQ